MFLPHRNPYNGVEQYGSPYAWVWGSIWGVEVAGGVAVFGIVLVMRRTWRAYLRR